ncbi:UvrD-helicase domain-containing protein [Candidatus Pantoea bituminis]|uniref:UvrD-helicase domain-containing protein n=1 Tax=Candidatus Pantoea bituminis TaxID=2831036 RepID=UPI0028111182|nr:UvrD-helicase domain-containing protein [Pantoea bituminis]
MTVEAVLGARRGMIVAPAGCGKTHLIADVLRVKPAKRYLVLTHTTAGVTALKKRLTSLAVPGTHYVVTTLDGWAVRLATSFPELCPTDVPPENGSLYYNSLRQHILTLLRAGNITDIIQASYSRLLVDEYQDCNTVQHELVYALAEILPTVTFGDPMQCIFSFSGPMPDWDNQVMNCFPPLDMLRTPWRWNNARTPALGEWLLACQSALHSGQAIQLDSCPAHVNFRQLTGVAANDLQMQQQEFYRLVRQNEAGSVLILGIPGGPIQGTNLHCDSTAWMWLNP